MTAPIKIKAEIMWACLETPNEMSNSYQVDLCNLSPQAVQAIQDMGIEVKSKEDKGDFITCKSKRPITAYDTTGAPIDGLAVGNGSKAVAVIGSYAWTFRNKEGISPSMKKLVITDLVTYDDPDVVSVDLDDEIL